MTASKRGFPKQEYDRAPFLLSPAELIRYLGSNEERGLSATKAQESLRKYGPNQVGGERGVQWWTLLFKQASNAMILVLILAMAVSFGVTDFIEGGVITAVIVLNIAIGFYQEFQAEKKMDSLRSLSSPSAWVLRDGNEMNIPSGEVVPGDIVSIKVGDTVPADLRLIEVMNLECEDKALTGESEPVSKEIDFEPKHGKKEDCGLADRLNMAYSTSTVTKGRGRGVVVFTGMSTAIGDIAASLQGSERPRKQSLSRKQGILQPFRGIFSRSKQAIAKFLGLVGGTPLQIKLSKLAYLLFGCAILLAIVVFGVNKFNVTNEVAIYAISTGIAIIPESLIAVLTITMVVGMTQMRKRRVVVRALSSLEALGGITNICSDKTGTLTEGSMLTRKAWIPGCGIYAVEESEYAFDPTSGKITLEPAPTSKKDIEEQRAAKDRSRSAAALTFEEPAEKLDRDRKRGEDLYDEKQEKSESPNVTPGLQAFLECAALCNIANVIRVVNDGKIEWKCTGDPTEKALQIFAHRFGRGKRLLEGKFGWVQTMEYPFDNVLKRMSVVYKRLDMEESMILTKGAVERVLDLCTKVGIGHHEETLTPELKEKILEQMGFLADQGLRVLAIARKPTREEIHERSRTDRSVVERDLILLGLAGLYDPPRRETKDAVRECTTAGIKVRMLTGDHPSTAAAIAKEVGIIPRNFGILPSDVAKSLVKTATEFDSMSEEEIDAMPTLPLVIARCAPDTKVKMIKALHRRKDYVAMTGDGVNDAPSLHDADVGIAMGLNGTDVAKSASDIVLTDDNFASIVNAIEEGRRMFDNIQKFILHLLASNVGEVILLVIGLGFKDTAGFSVFPLSPLQILWINMLTSSFPAFGLGRERASREIMHRPPHDNRKGVFTWQIIADMVVYGTIMGALTLLTFVIIVYGTGDGQPSLGFDCNRHYSSSCTVVFRARAAVFAELTWLILISAWEIKSLRNSLFNLSPSESTGKFPSFTDLWENQFLFWAVVIGALSVFPAVYIPGLNHSVFKHKGISWEWGLCFGAVIIFVLGVELWKLGKRRLGWFAEASPMNVRRRRTDSGLSLKQGFFSFATSKARSDASDATRVREDV